MATSHRSIPTGPKGQDLVDEGLRAIRVVLASGGAGSGGTSAADGTDFVPGSTAGTPLMGVVDDVATAAGVEGDLVVPRSTPQRALHVNVRDQNGGEVGVATVASVDAVRDRLPPALDADGGVKVHVQNTEALATQATLAEVAADTANLDIALSAHRDAITGGKTLANLEARVAALESQTVAANKVRHLSVDLGVARTNVAVLSGARILWVVVGSHDGDANSTLRVGSATEDAHPVKQLTAPDEYALVPVCDITGDLVLTNAAQSGKTLRLRVGVRV